MAACRGHACSAGPWAMGFGKVKSKKLRGARRHGVREDVGEGVMVCEGQRPNGRILGRVGRPLNSVGRGTLLVYIRYKCKLLYIIKYSLCPKL